MNIERERAKIRRIYNKSVIFFTVLCGNLKIHEHAILGYEKLSKVTINMIFDKFRL
jgi:hypothetical protein